MTQEEADKIFETEKEKMLLLTQLIPKLGIILMMILIKRNT
jgi:hypothetical protein